MHIPTIAHLWEHNKPLFEIKKSFMPILDLLLNVDEYIQHTVESIQKIDFNQTITTNFITVCIAKIMHWHYD